VTVVTSEFIGLGQDTVRSQGVSDYPFVVVPHPLGMIPGEEVRKRADDAFPEIVRMAGGWEPKLSISASEEAYPAERFFFDGTVHDMNRFFFDKGWSLGLPLEPPTPEAVARMLTGTLLEPSAVIGQVPPRMGTLTIELAAVHAAMAGCKPEYLPVLVSVLEALLQPEANWRGAATTTATTAALIIVNGPIVRQIGIASTQGAAGADHHPNAAIGYAVNLIADIIGGAKSPSPDKSTLAAPSDFVAWIFGENEEALPQGWEPLHVQRGFTQSDNVVTVMATYPPVENIDHWSVTPEEHLRWWSRVVSPLTGVGGPCEVSQMDGNYIIGIGPEHAQLIAGSGWSQTDFKKAFWEHVRAPLSAWPRGGPQMEGVVQRLGPVSPETLIPITVKAEQFFTVIAGGAGKHSHYFAPFPRCLPVSRKIDASGRRLL
jgi:hypothetical protein